MLHEITKPMTLCLIRDGDDRVLFGRKQRKIGAGKWNGFGGHIEDGESTEDAARREVLEETNLVVGSLEYMGVVNFRVEKPEQVEINQVHMFVTNEFSGELRETDEMKEFKWFDINDLPVDEMQQADAHFIPELLAGKYIGAEFVYDENFNLLKWELNEIEPELELN